MKAGVEVAGAGASGGHPFLPARLHSDTHPLTLPSHLPKVYVISVDGSTAYQVTVDPATYLPLSVGTPIAQTGSTYPAAFCTADGPLGVSSFGPFGQVSSFTSGSFTKVGVSGQIQASGLSGAAVAPVC